MNLLNKILLRILSGLLLCGLLFNTATAQSVQIGEVGQQSGVDHNWMTVNLTGTYTDPIIVAKSRNLNGTDVSQTRVRNVTGTSFEVKVKDFDFEAQNRSAQIVSFVVVERGAWVLPNGQKIEAGDVSMTCCDVDASTSFTTQFAATPAVIVTPNTDRIDSVYYRVKDLTSTSFNARFTDQDAAGDPDTLNWIAMDEGGDTTYGIAELITTTQGVDKTWTYGSTFAASPEVFLTSRSYLDTSPMTNRIRNVATTTEVIFYQQRNTSNNYHLAAEDVSAIALPSGSVMGNSALTVTNTNDSGGGSLRAAIDYANANTTEDDIIFAIDGTGPHKIIMTSTPPSLTDTGISIDGTTQTGASCGDLWSGTPHSLMIEVNAPSTLYSTMRVFGNSITIKGLSLTRGSRSIFLDSGTSDTVIQCNYIGLTPDGVADGPNANAISVAGSDTLIGGSSVGQGNVIGDSTFSGLLTKSGSAGTIIQGNFIGTDPLGTSSRANGNSGITHESGAGTWADITGNLISGNTESGIAVSDNDSLTGVGGADVIIAGNYIGVDRTGNAALPNGDDGISFVSGSISGVTIGGTAAADRNIISGNDADGIYIRNQSDISILGNYIGLTGDGMSALQNNGNHGIYLENGNSDIVIGNGLASGRNVIVSIRPIRMDGAIGDITLNGNYLGTNLTGNTSLQIGSGSDEDAIVIAGGDFPRVSILENVIGGFGGEAIEVSVGANVTDLIVQGNNIGVGADDVTALPIAPSVSGAIQIRKNASVSNLAMGGTGTNEGNLIANSLSTAIYIAADANQVTGSIIGNIIRDNSDHGVLISQITSKVAVYTNEIHNNGGLAINLEGGTEDGNGVSANDSGDTDTGPNDLLNFPLINAISASGSTSVDYSVTLDVPANTEGYRIEFYKNSSPDTTNGEGEIFLGFVDTGDHLGGAIDFDGTFTASESVSSGDSISATATRKTGALAYDITSEFSVNKTAQSSLVVTNTNDSGAGSLRAAIDFANANTSEDDISFAIDGSGPHTITLASALPSITDNGISIDGTTQTGASCGDLWAGTPHTLLIQLDGVDKSNHGLIVDGDNFSVKGISATRFEHAIRLNTGGSSASVTCSYLGLAPDGTESGNGYGVNVQSTGPVIGGANAGDGNVISANSLGGIAASGATTDVIIEGNFVGTDPTGMDARPNLIVALRNLGVVGYAAIKNNLISGNTAASGFQLDANDTLSTAFSFTGNYIGTNRTGLAALPNRDGISLASYTGATITIGGTSLEDRNIISGNNEHGVELNTVSGINILGNYIGLGADGIADVGNAQMGIRTVETTALVIGDGTAGGRNIIGFNNDAGLKLSTNSAATVHGNYFGVAANGTSAAGNASFNVDVQDGSTALIQDNIIANTLSDDGIKITGATTRVAIIGNSIYANSQQGIEIDDGTPSGEGVNDNDTGDSDTGPNELLNYPLINAISASGSTSVDYSVTLDVPANTEGYRIEFYKNTSPDTTNGEGEIFLGFADTGDHLGGAIDFDGTFTASENVSSGDSISATTTRKTGALAYDITSEFSVNKTAQSSLVVTNTNDSGAGSLRAAIDFANANTAEDNIIFDIPGTGPFTISPTSALPTVTDDGVSIDGTTQSGASCGQLTTGTPHTLMIRVDGLSVGGTKIGFNVTAANSSLRGLSVTGFTSRGISIENGADNNLIECSYIGVETDGETKAPNVRETNTPAINLEDITGGAIRNSLISGNDADSTDLAIAVNGVTNYTFEGNIIGLNASGTTALPNGNYGIFLLGSNDNVTLGGITPETRNIISGNGSDGIYVNTGSSNIDILGNYIGLSADGSTAIKNGSNGIYLANANNVDIGNGASDGRNIISGNEGRAIDIQTGNNISILGNYIGTDVTGLNGLGNGGASNLSTFNLSDVTDVNIGNGTAAGRNIISGNTGRPISTEGTSTNLAINDNYIGTDITGNTALKNGTGASSTQDDVFRITNVNNLDILNNVIGPYNSEGFEFWGGSVGDDIVIQGNSFGLGADGTTPFVSGRSIHGHILFGNGYAATNVVIGGTGAGEGNILANALNAGIRIVTTAGFTGNIIGNQIYNNGGGGIEIGDTATVAIYQNAIYNNNDLGIDLNSNGVTDNDSGDGDTGANGLLNFPVINDFASDGSTGMTYDINLDVPSGDYRIDFYRNSAADSSGYGEGEFHLGFVEFTHSGGDQQHTGTFTANSAVIQGNYIAATTTRKTGPSAYDITSEFSLTTTTGSPTELTAAKSVVVYDPTNAGLYSLPGNDVISSLTVTNPGSSPADADSIVIIDAIPPEVTFYNGDIDEGGPESNAVSFVQTGGANLTFTYLSDVKYSNSGIRPNDMSGCNYTPSAGYDTNVTFLCLNPKGAMAAGNPDPTFTVAYRAKIK